MKVVQYLLISASLMMSTGACGQEDPYRIKREQMVRDQIVAYGIRDAAVLAAMRSVPRHLFVPHDLKPYAYVDGPLGIGFNQTISQPYIVAYMTEVLELKSTDKVLEIGTGSGYQAAVLAEIVDQVYTIEIVKELGRQAEQRLLDLNYTNIHVKIGDGYNGWPENGPYDAIIVTAAPEKVPPPLIDQLKEDGRMIIPVGPVNSIQELILIRKKDNRPVTRKLIPVRFVPFTRK